MTRKRRIADKIVSCLRGFAEALEKGDSLTGTFRCTTIALDNRRDQASNDSKCCWRPFKDIGPEEHGFFLKAYPPYEAIEWFDMGPAVPTESLPPQDSEIIEDDVLFYGPLQHPGTLKDATTQLPPQ